MVKCDRLLRALHYKIFSNGILLGLSSMSDPLEFLELCKLTDVRQLFFWTSSQPNSLLMVQVYLFP